MEWEGLYLGAPIDATTGDRSEGLIDFDPDDLTTHGVIVGMTGSGKTGLGIIYIEEALRRGIPVLVIDPKGDMTNLLLTFPDLLPADFEHGSTRSTLAAVARRFPRWPSPRQQRGKKDWPDGASEAPISGLFERVLNSRFIRRARIWERLSTSSVR